MTPNYFRRLFRTKWRAAAAAVAAVGLAGAAQLGVADVGAAPEPAGLAVADTVNFAKDILPIFQQRCAKCHGGIDEDGDVRTESGLTFWSTRRLWPAPSSAL